MRYIYCVFILLTLSGCSQKSINILYNSTKRASYNASSDYLTWTSLLVAGALYATPYDDKFTQFRRENEVFEIDYDEYYRTANAVETYLTALMINDTNYTTKLKRMGVEFSAYSIAGYASDSLNANIQKSSPSGTYSSSIGSRHTVPTFAGSAMTRRNVERLDIHKWGKYTLNTLSYLTAMASTATRVEDGGHSVADQLISVSVGNFIGLFMHDLFMLDENISIGTSVSNSSASISLSYRY